MKKKLIVTGIVAGIAAVAIGCGGGGTGGAGDTMKYAGTVTPGDFVHFSRSGTTISYEVEGDVFGSVTGEVSVTDMTGDGYLFKGTVNGKEAYFFTTGNIGMAAIPIEGQTYLGIGLREVQGGLTSADVVGSYAYGEVIFNTATHVPNDSDACLINVVAGGTATVNCASGFAETGGWVIAEDQTHILYKGNTAAGSITKENAEARAVMRPAEEGGRKGFLVDLSGGKGFGIGLERRRVTQDNVEGSYLAIDYLDRKLLEVTVARDAGDAERLTYTTAEASVLSSRGSTNKMADVPGGWIKLNHDCSGTPRDGVICIHDNGGELFNAAIDNAEGYFAAIGSNNVIVGVKKP
jgi:hypothetical protein